MVEAAQEDRNAAADILDEISSLTQDDGIGQVADLIRDGEYDEHDTVQRTARHRQAGVQQGLDMAAWALEEQAKATPLGHENIQRGASTYNWLMSHARLIRKLGGGDA